MVIKLPSFDATKYAKHEDVDRRVKLTKPLGTTATSKSRKRTRSYAVVGDDEVLSTGVDYRAKAESLFQSLWNTLINIFEAEDSLEPDTSGKIGEKSAKFWAQHCLDDSSPCLATALQVKLENSIRMVVKADKFESVPVDDVLRLEKLCDNSVRFSEGLQIRLPDVATATDTWISENGDILDNGLKTCRTLLRIMSAGRSEKQICSEDVLQNVLRFTRQLTEEVFLPMIELRNNGKTAELFKALVPHKKSLNGILHELTTLFELISLLLTREQLTDDAITTLEYCMIPVVFVETATHEKDSILKIAKVERFRVSAMDVLEKVRYEAVAVLLVLTGLDICPAPCTATLLVRLHP